MPASTICPNQPYPTMPVLFLKPPLLTTVPTMHRCTGQLLLLPVFDLACLWIYVI